MEWWGQPRQGFYLRPFDAFIIPFSLMWAGIPTAAFVGGLLSGSAGPGLLFLLLFVIPGQYITWGRFVVDIQVRRGIFYVVTDRRSLIVGTRWVRRSRSFPRGSTEVELSEHRGGRGTIRFGDSGFAGGRRNPWGEWFGCFDQITEAPAVFRMVRGTAST